jgi:hypothetical protein
MTLKLIGAGFGRTGTLSVYTALNQLGLPCYHMVEVLINKQNRSHLGFWHRVATQPAGTQHDWEQVFANYAATMDNPACCVWHELCVAYPDARVLLTVHPRGADAWYDSSMETTYIPEQKWQFRILEWTFPAARRFAVMSRKLIWQRSHHGTMAHRERAVARYEQHITEVKAAVPADRLLVYSVDQGWQPLCAFLDLPIPDTPFPKVNDRTAYKIGVRKLTWLAYAVIVLGVAAISGVINELARMFV